MCGATKDGRDDFLVLNCICNTIVERDSRACAFFAVVYVCVCEMRCVYNYAFGYLSSLIEFDQIFANVTIIKCISVIFLFSVRVQIHRATSSCQFSRLFSRARMHVPLTIYIIYIIIFDGFSLFT